MMVRILPPEPASPEVGEPARDSWRKARQWRAFAIRLAVSRLPILGNTRPIRRASPATTAKIPVFRRQRPETGFDHHWRGRQQSIAIIPVGAGVGLLNIPYILRDEPDMK